MGRSIQVEIFAVPGCARCGRAKAVLAEVAEAFGGAVRWRAVDVVAELDYAVTLGVRATPAIVIDGTLVFTGLPGEAELRRALEARLSPSSDAKEHRP